MERKDVRKLAIAMAIVGALACAVRASYPPHIQYLWDINDGLCDGAVLQIENGRDQLNAAGEDGQDYYDHWVAQVDALRLLNDSYAQASDVNMLGTLPEAVDSLRTAAAVDLDLRLPPEM